MADLIDDAELGGAGVLDAATAAEASVLNWAAHLAGVDTHLEGTTFAADVFAGQTAVEPSGREELRRKAAAAELHGGVLSEAAHRTTTQIATGLSSGAKAVIGIAAAAFGLVVAVQLVRVLR